jgi:hypothetical protein
MASVLSSPFHGLSPDEVVPAAADLTSLKQASILQGRRRVRFQPQTGVTAAPGNIVQFVLSDSTGLLDVNSMVFSATITVPQATGQAATDINLLDEGVSFCRRIQILANGSLVEDIDNAHRAANAAVLSSADSSWYKGDGSFMNFWKLNEALSVSAPTAQNNVAAHAVEVSNQLSYRNRGVQMAFPLGIVAPSLASNKYWPLRSMGELVIQMTLAQAAEAIWCNISGQTPTYTLSDIFLECDIVVPHPAYASLLDRITQLPSEDGLNLPILTRLVSQGQSIPASVNSLTESAIVLSRATTNLRRLIYMNQPTAGLNDYTYPSVSCFPDGGMAGFQARIGSLYFPSQPANSKARMFWMTAAAFGEPASTDKSAVFNRHNYDETTLFADGSVKYQVPGAGGQLVAGPLTDGTGLRWPYADFAPVAYNFDAFKGGEQLANDGVSILGQAKKYNDFFYNQEEMSLGFENPKLVLCF